MDYEPLSVALKFGFIALLYLFLLWIVFSSRADLRRLGTVAPAPDATGAHRAAAGGPPAPAPVAWLVVTAGGGLQPGERFELFGSLSIGRSAEADLPIEDRYASGIHVRVFEQGGRFYVEDMQSTNGTRLNGEPVDGEAELQYGDRIGIGDTELMFEAG